MTAPRYTFAEVRAALREHWGIALHRGGEMADMGRDGRWTTEYSKTGFVCRGEMGGGYGFRRFTSLRRVVEVADLAPVIERARSRR